VTWHWIAGAVLTGLVIFHIFHASFWMDFRAIWPDRIDVADGYHRIRRFLGRPAPPPRKSAKYPLDVKLSHAAIMAAGLTAIVTGVFMMSRVRTIFFPRNPYLFSDMTWGIIYVLHGLAGVGLIALVMVHVYFTLIRPENRPSLKAMIFGWMSRDSYLEEYDPKRWAVEATTSSPESRGPKGLGAGNAE
jgi:cytochrome b subunit of formate dehydrogenase